MIAYIKGKLEEAGEDYAVIDHNGMGYLIGMSMNDLEQLRKQEGIVKVFTYQHVREDNISLFGFLTAEKLNLFKLLIGVSGVGPKAAISIISSNEPANIILAILTSDDRTLCKAAGVGKKLALRIILELKDKFKNYESMTGAGFELEPEGMGQSAEQEAVGALMALGYTRGEAASALQKVDRTQSLEEVVKQALRTLMRG